MGLDLFAHNVDPVMFKDIPPLLCGSMFTDGQSSIRGKVYANFISEVCDVELYQEKLSTTELNQIITRLQAYLMETPDEYSYSGFTSDEVDALLKWFTTVKENNGTVIGWW